MPAVNYSTPSNPSISLFVLPASQVAEGCGWSIDRAKTIGVAAGKNNGESQTPGEELLSIEEVVLRVSLHYSTLI